MRSIFLWLLLLQAGLLHAQDSLQLPPHAPQASVNGGEYFFGNDPGFGSGMPFNGLQTGPSLPFVSTESIAALPAGAHRLQVRMRDTLGNWSMTNSRFLYIINTTLALPPHAVSPAITGLEYFIDTDPGVGNGISVNVPAALTVALPNIPVDISNLAAGVHKVHLRLRDSSGAWSLTTLRQVALVSVNINLPAAAVPDSISALEYFFDEDPGIGNGMLLTVPTTVQLDHYTFPADISSLTDGVHRLFIRTLGGRSLAAMYSFTIGQPLPIQVHSFMAAQQDGDAILSWKAADATTQTFIPERSTDGVTFLPLDSIMTHKNGDPTYTYPDRDIRQLHVVKLFYRLKMREAGGTFRYTPVVSLMPENSASSAYPNPFTKDIHVVSAVRLQEGAPVRIRIRDIAGHCVYEAQQYAGQGALIVSPGDLPAGSYLLSVEADGYGEIFRLTKK